MQRAVREQEERTQLLAHTVENVVVRSVQDVLGRLNSIEDALLLSPSLLEADNTALQDILKSLLAQTPSLREVAVHGADGQWIASSRGKRPVDAERALNCSTRLMAGSLADFLIVQPQNGRYLGDPTSHSRIQHIPVCVSLKDDMGTLLATVTGAINPDYLHELFRPSHELNPVFIELYDYSGNFLAKGEAPDNRLAQSNHTGSVFDTRLAEAEFGTFHQRFSSGDEQMLDVVSSYRSTSILPLVVIVHLDLGLGLSAWQKESDVILWIFLALITAICVGGAMMVLSLVRKHRMEGEIRLLSTAISSTANAVFITDQNGRIQWINKAFENLTGWGAKDVVERTPAILNSGTHETAFFTKLWDAILAGKVWRGQITNVTRSGQKVIVDQTVTPILDGAGEVTNFIAVHEDVTLRTEAEDQARYLAQHDTLTGLPNRHAFGLALERLLLGEEGARLIVFFVDLDHFKTINDTLGHQAGDDVLLQATRRMRALLPDSSELFRLGGDEFSILIGENLSAEAVKSIAVQLLEQLALPMEFAESHFTLSGSIGITFGDAGKSSASVLLKQADMAMYKAKHSGRNTFCFFDENMDYRMQRHVELEQGMRDALHEGVGFELAFQPVIRATDLKPVSLEVLMRWHNVQGEWVPPAEFIPVAEDIGLILDLGRWQIRELFSRVGEWKNSALSDVKISLNVSSVQLARDNVAERLIHQLDQYQIAPEMIIVEVTETALMSDGQMVAENLKLLRDRGISISIDDFGTGYSSLKYISELDANVLKIDRSFVQNIGLRERDEEVIMATVALARNLDMVVVAEGVETQAQLDFLRGLQVDYLQGFYFAKPMFEGDLFRYLDSVGSLTSCEAEVVPA